MGTTCQISLFVTQSAFVQDKSGTGESEGDYVATTYEHYITDAGNSAIYLSGRSHLVSVPYVFMPKTLKHMKWVILPREVLYFIWMKPDNTDLYVPKLIAQVPMRSGGMQVPIETLWPGEMDTMKVK